MTNQKGAIAFVWENFGPGHADRVEAVANSYLGRRSVIGIELAAKSDVYEWHSESRPNFAKLTIFRNVSLSKVGILTRAWKTIGACLHSKATDIFFCHYEHPATFLSAVILRLLGKNVYMMNDSKFDDYTRYLHRELGKSILYLPYVGGIASGSRALDYIRFLGIPKNKIAGNYNCLSLARIRNLAGTPPAPDGLPFEERDFVIVARLVEKKNLFMALASYDLYRERCKNPRKLKIFGSGPLEKALRDFVAEKNLQELVYLAGFVQTAEVCQALGSALALLLPSTEEQFGNVVIEAQALGLPVILSDNCGARDQLVRSGVNGFVIEPDNPQGLAFFMDLIDRDKVLWRRMCEAATKYSVAGDSSIFSNAITKIIESDQ